MTSIARCKVLCCWACRMLRGVVVFAWMVSSAVSFADEPVTTVVIEGCSVFDSESETMLAGRTIVVRGERIVAVAAVGEKV